MLLLPPKIFSHFQQNNWEIFREMYFPRVNSNIFSNSLEKLAKFLISLKLEFKKKKKNPQLPTLFMKKKLKNVVEIGLQNS